MTEKTAVIYVRVSDPGQAEEELSIPSQMERCRARAAELGATVARVFADEGKSGRFDTRQAFRDAIAYCETFPTDFMIVWSTSRFARNKIDSAIYKVRLEKAGTKLIYVSQAINRDDDTGWVTESMFEIFDELQSRTISKDTRRSMETNARNGHWNGGVPPFGCRAAPDPNNEKRRRLIHNEEEVGVARQIVDMRLGGMGPKAIALNLNQRGLLNRGRRWTRKGIGALLQNHALIGCTVFGRSTGRTKRAAPRNSWIIVQNHEPIIDKATFDAIQALIGNQNDAEDAGAGGTLRSNFVFTGLLRCGFCGGAMTTSSGTGRSKTYHYYKCRNAIEHSGCVGRRVPAPEFDGWLVGDLLNTLFTQASISEIVLDLKKEYGTWSRDRKRRRQLIVRKIEEAQKKRTKLFEVLELYGKDAPNLGDMTSRLREHNATVRAYEEELVALQEERQPEIAIEGGDIRQMADLFAEVIRTTENPRKLRQFFTLFVDKITVAENGVKIEYRPDRLISADGAVRSEGIWLPGSGALRTRAAGMRTLAIALPDRFCLAA